MKLLPIEVQRDLITMKALQSAGISEEDFLTNLSIVETEDDEILEKLITAKNNGG